MGSEPDVVAAEFKAAAERYVGVIDAAVQPASEGASSERPREDLLADVADALSALYNRALRLPDVWDDAWTFEGESGRELDVRARVYAALSGRFGEIDFYWTVVAFGKPDTVYENEVATFHHRRMGPVFPNDP